MHCSFLNLSISSSTQFQVMMGNGEQLVCNSQCLNVPVLLSKTTFHIDFFISPINGADLVLVFNDYKLWALLLLITQYSKWNLLDKTRKFFFKDFQMLFYMKFHQSNCKGYKQLMLSQSFITYTYTHTNNLKILTLLLFLQQFNLFSPNTTFFFKNQIPYPLVDSLTTALL